MAEGPDGASDRRTRAEEQANEGDSVPGMRVWSTELTEHVGERVQLQGWLLNHRPLARVDFAILRDGKGECQIVVTDEGERAELAKWLDETVFEVEGTPEAEPAGAGWRRARRAEVHARPGDAGATAGQPPRAGAQGAAAVRSSTTPRSRSATRSGARCSGSARSSLAGMRATLDAAGFVEIQTPKIVASATETGANVFRIDYFGRPGYLAQSPQFYKQMMVGVFERVYEIGPVFRAEPHDTVRHLAEYVSLDVELGFIDDHFTVMAVLRDVLAGMVGTMQERGTRELELLDLTLPDVPDTIPHLDFVAAQELIERETGEKGVVGEPDLAPAHERFLGEWALREHGSDFLFVVGYPMSKRPFYTHPNPERPEYSNSFDLLFRGLELVTGGQRLHRYDDYVDGARSRGPGPRAVRVLPRSVQARDAAARRVRDRLGAVDGPPRRGEQRARDDALPARHQPHPAVTTFDFAGQVVLVTGGSRGIGRGIAERFAADGARVVVCGRTAPEAGALPAHVEFVTADVRDADQVAALVDGIAERHGRLDVLVNNAGGAPPADTATVSPRFSAGIIALNLTAALVCAQLANGVMQRQEQGGSIVNIASVSGIRPSPNSAAYGAAKAGLINLTQTLGVEFAPKVRVNAVTVGLVVTEQAHLFYGDDAGIAAVGAHGPARAHGRPDRRRRRVPVPRVAARALRQRRQHRRPRRRRTPRLHGRRREHPPWHVPVGSQVQVGTSGVLAADGHDLAGHVGRQVAREEHDHVRDFPRLGRAPERLFGGELVEQLFRRHLARGAACIASDGATALMRTLWCAASIAAQRVSAMTPAFAAA